MSYTTAAATHHHDRHHTTTTSTAAANAAAATTARYLHHPAMFYTTHGAHHFTLPQPSSRFRAANSVAKSWRLTRRYHRRRRRRRPAASDVLTHPAPRHVTCSAHPIPSHPPPRAPRLKIAEFAESKDFPKPPRGFLFTKGMVNGDDARPAWKFMKEQTGAADPGETCKPCPPPYHRRDHRHQCSNQTLPGWNFKGKFLVAPDGTVSDAANEGDFLATAIEELM